MKDYRFSNNTAKRRYELDLEDGQIAMIEYYLAPGGEVALTHTEVPYDHAGQGVGSQIAFKALTDIREHIIAKTKRTTLQNETYNLRHFSLSKREHLITL